MSHEHWCAIYDPESRCNCGGGKTKTALEAENARLRGALTNIANLPPAAGVGRHKEIALDALKGAKHV